MVDFVLKMNSGELDDCVFDCLQTWFRNTNQRYPITSWLKEFNLKASGAWGGVPKEGEGVRRGVGIKASHEAGF